VLDGWLWIDVFHSFFFPILTLCPLPFSSSFTWSRASSLNFFVCAFLKYSPLLNERSEKMKKSKQQPKKQPQNPKQKQKKGVGMMCRVARLLILGVYDKESSLSILLKGDAKQMMRMIWEYVFWAHRKAVITQGIYVVCFFFFVVLFLVCLD
jgi:hypothetical protein